MNPRQFAFFTLRAIVQGRYADVALEQALKSSELAPRDRGLVTELVYGCVRRQRTLDALIDQLAHKPAFQQPPNLRLILHLGLYQLRYLNQVPANAAVNTTVDLAKENKLTGLAGLVNGILRQYLRLAETADPLRLPAEPVSRLGVLHSYPGWLIELWLGQLGDSETTQLCEWLNQPPTIDLRINPLKTNLETVEAALQAENIPTQRFAHLPQALRLLGAAGAIHNLPGYQEGWWSVQDASAQLVSQILNPQPGEVVMDACAAPGGKTTHIAELMQDQGTIWACDRTPSRLKRLAQNLTRLQLHSIQIATGDSQTMTQFQGQADRVLVDAPCSGLGTLHRHADARWRQTPASVADLATQQFTLLNNTATWVKPGGCLVYATCTTHPQETTMVVEQFLGQNPGWQLEPIAGPEGEAAQPTLTLWPHRQQMDGFFVARLVNS
jgi:16S rRNA (cytosine967-C5)-methyltransferase